MGNGDGEGRGGLAWDCVAGGSVWKGGIGSMWKGKVCLGLVAGLLTFFFVYGRNRGVVLLRWWVRGQVLNSNMQLVEFLESENSCTVCVSYSC